MKKREDCRMEVYDVKSISERLCALAERANESLGTYDSSMLGIGRYVPGKSPWEKHTNGDELLFVTDGQVSIEVLEDDGSSKSFQVGDGQLFVVPTGKWHQLTTTDNVNIMFASPSEEGAERTREFPFGK
jgi:mannose-6-phosphate isomerase-like protein (cupin superfamily)